MGIFKDDKETHPVFPDDVKHKVDAALSNIPHLKESTKDEVRESSLSTAYIQHEEKSEDHDKGEWTKYGLKRDEASARAMNALRSELGTLAESQHQGWNSAIEAMMLQGNTDPSKLWAMYRNLVAADTRIEIGGGPGDSRPDATPAVAESKDKNNSVSLN